LQLSRFIFCSWDCSRSTLFEWNVGFWEKFPMKPGHTLTCWHPVVIWANVEIECNNVCRYIVSVIQWIRLRSEVSVPHRKFLSLIWHFISRLKYLILKVDEWSGIHGYVFILFYVVEYDGICHFSVKFSRGIDFDIVLLCVRLIQVMQLLKEDLWEKGDLGVVVLVVVGACK